MLMSYLESPELTANELPFLGVPSRKRYLVPGSPQIKCMHSHLPPINQYEQAKTSSSSRIALGKALKEMHLKLPRKLSPLQLLILSWHSQSDQFCSFQALPSPSCPGDQGCPPPPAFLTPSKRRKKTTSFTPGSCCFPFLRRKTQAGTPISDIPCLPRTVCSGTPSERQDAV